MKKRTTKNNEIFWDLGQISKKFRRMEKFSVSPGRILKKCKREKNFWGHLEKLENFLESFEKEL